MKISQYLIDNGYVKKVKHPTEDLYLYNYTQLAQFEGINSSIWKDYEELGWCRGLILDGGGNIIARPFKKFFNLEQYDELPPYKSFEVYDKLDGSLLIIYRSPNGSWDVATRGSFTSEQATWARQFLQLNHNDFLKEIAFSSMTILAEAIYPQNRIVVDYGGHSRVVLLSMVDNYSGRDLCRELLEEYSKRYSIPIVPIFNGVTDFTTIRDTIKRDNAEGFVIKFDTGLRVKMKYEEYVKLHSLMTNVSTTSLWECLKDNIDIKDIFKDVPDEMFSVILEEKNKIEAKYRQLETISAYAYGEVGRLDSRKKQASILLKYYKPLASVVFAMLDDKDYKSILWKLCKPEYKKITMYAQKDEQ